MPLTLSQETHGQSEKRGSFDHGGRDNHGHLDVAGHFGLASHAFDGAASRSCRCRSRRRSITKPAPNVEPAKMVHVGTGRGGRLGGIGRLLGVRGQRQCRRRWS